MGQRSASSSSIATSVVDDTSPETAFGKKSEFTLVDSRQKPNSGFFVVLLCCFPLTGFFDMFCLAPPMFLPISSTPQPERRQVAQRRHSIEKETPTNVRQFLPPTRQSSKSLVSS